jgi:phage FluMu gp28-like protein
MAIKELETSWLGDEGEYLMLEARLPGGTVIKALPANPDTARGHTANLYLDEFAIHQNSREIWGALYPLISEGGLKLRVTSTPKGKGNKFYELMTSTNTVSLSACGGYLPGS